MKFLADRLAQCARQLAIEEIQQVDDKQYEQRIRSTRCGFIHGATYIIFSPAALLGLIAQRPDGRGEIDGIFAAGSPRGRALTPMRSLELRSSRDPEGSRIGHERIALVELDRSIEGDLVVGF